MALGIVGPLDYCEGASSSSGNSWPPFLQRTMFGNLPHHFTRFPGLKKGGRRKKTQARDFGKGRVLRHKGPKKKRTDGSTDEKSTKAPKVTILYI